MKKIHRILSFHGVAVCIRAENKTIIKVSCCFLLTERFTFFRLCFSPDHFIYNARVGLNYFDHLCRYVFLGIVGDRYSEIAVFIHIHRRIDRLQKALFVNASENKACLVERLGAFG